MNASRGRGQISVVDKSRQCGSGDVQIVHARNERDSERANGRSAGKRMARAIRTAPLFCMESSAMLFENSQLPMHMVL